MKTSLGQTWACSDWQITVRGDEVESSRSGFQQAHEAEILEVYGDQILDFVPVGLAVKPSCTWGQRLGPGRPMAREWDRDPPAGSPPSVFGTCQVPA